MKHCFGPKQNGAACYALPGALPLHTFLAPPLSMSACITFQLSLQMPGAALVLCCLTTQKKHDQQHHL